MKFKRKTLPNDLTILTVPTPSFESATAMVMVGAGSRFETRKNNGISHFLEHMAFKGTKSRPTFMEIAGLIDGIGGEFNAFTSKEYTGYYIKAGKNNIEICLNLLSDMLKNSLLDEKEIEKEKGVIIEEINLYEDTPMRNIGDIFERLLYGDTPMGWDTAGEKDVIRSLKRADFVNYMDNLYSPSNMTVVFAGGIDEDSSVSLADKYFSDMKKYKVITAKPVKEDQKKPEVRLKTKKTEQTHLILGLRAFDMYDADRFALAVLAAVLGQGMSSRLFHRLRDDLGMAYYVRTFTDLSTDCGVMGVTAGVTLSRTGEAVGEIIAELRRARDELVPPAELKKAKDFKIGTMFLNLESSDSLGEFYGFTELFRQEPLSPNDVARHIRAVSAADVRRVARRIFSDANLNLALVGPLTDSRQLKKLLHF